MSLEATIMNQNLIFSLFFHIFPECTSILDFSISAFVEKKAKKKFAVQTTRYINCRREVYQLKEYTVKQTLLKVKKKKHI